MNTQEIDPLKAKRLALIADFNRREQERKEQEQKEREAWKAKRPAPMTGYQGYEGSRTARTLD